VVFVKLFQPDVFKIGLGVENVVGNYEDRKGKGTQ